MNKVLAAKFINKLVKEGLVTVHLSKRVLKFAIELLNNKDTYQDHYGNYILATLTEEAGEVSQIVGKCQRFGLDDYHPKTGNVPNRELMRREVNDLIAVAEMLGIKRDEKLVEKKKWRVTEYWQYAKDARGIK